MAKITFTNVKNNNTLSAINDNFAKVAAEMQNKILYRANPPGETNTVRNDIDMDGNDLINVDTISTEALTIDGQPVTAADFQALANSFPSTLRTPGAVPVNPIPSAGARAGRFLAFDAAGQPIATNGGGADPSLRSDLALSTGSALVNFTQAGTGAVTRTVQAKLRDRVDIRDFGYGVVSDSVALQRVIDYAYSVRVIESGGGLYVQEASIPVINATGLSLTLTAAIQIPAQCEIDFTGTVLDATAVVGNVFVPFDASGMWKLHIIGGTVKHADTVFDMQNPNTAGGLILIDGTRFDDVTVQVAQISVQSTTVHFRNCAFLFVKKVATIAKCDFILFSDCILRPNQGGMDTNEQVMFDNSGKLELRRLICNPGTITGTPVNIAWVANRYDAAVFAGGGRSGVFIARDCRWGGEAGSMTLVNNYADTRPGSATVGTVVDISGGDAVSADGTREAGAGTRRCIVRLFAVPNILSVVNLDGVGGANLIDKATTTALTGSIINRITTFGNSGSEVGVSTNSGTFLPPELVKYAAKDPIVYNITGNKNFNVSAVRGGLVTNDGTAAATNCFCTLPFALPGMEITFANTQTGSGFIDVATQVGDVMNGGFLSGGAYSFRLNFNDRMTLKCDTTGVWYAVGGLELTASVVYDPPSLADGAGVSTTIALTRAALGDQAIVSFSNDLQGITLTAWCTLNTVNVRFQNESGGVLDLASGTLRVRVLKV